MPGPNGERCDECYFWDRMGISEWGHCRKNAPSPIIAVARDKPELILPAPKEDVWCGDFRSTKDRRH